MFKKFYLILIFLLVIMIFIGFFTHQNKLPGLGIWRYFIDMFVLKFFIFSELNYLSLVLIGVMVMSIFRSF